MSVTLTVGDIRVITLSADGSTVLDTQTNPNPYTFASLGELKCVEIDVTLGAAETFLGTQIFFNPALFGFDNYLFPETSGNNSGFYYTVSGSTLTATDYDMNLQNCSQVQENMSCKIEFSAITPNPAATIKLYFYVTADTANYLQSETYSAILNECRLRTTAFPARTLILLGGTQSQINHNKYWGVFLDDDSAFGYYIKVTDLATTVFDSVTATFTVKANINSVNHPNVAPSISSGTFKLYRGTTEVSEIQLANDTKVEIRANCATAITNVMAWLVRSDTTSQAINFTENYEASFAEITTLGAGNVLNNAIVSPSVAPALEGGTTYLASFYIDKDEIDQAGKYKIIAVWYDTANAKVNTWISSEYSCGGVPDYVPTDEELNFLSFFDDYNGQYSGNYLGVAPEERLKATVKIVYERNTALFTPRITGLTNVITSNDLRKFLYKIEINTYWIDGVNKHYYTQDIVNRKQGDLYELPDYITIDSPDYTKEFNLRYNFRVRFEMELQNLASYVDGVLQEKPLVNMNWAGKTIWIEYKFYLRYQTANPTYEDCLVYNQKLEVKEYENEQETPKLTQTDDLINVCWGDQYCPLFMIDNVYSPEDFRFIGTIHKRNYNSYKKTYENTTEMEFGCDNNNPASVITVNDCFDNVVSMNTGILGTSATGTRINTTTTCDNQLEILYLRS